MHDRTRSAALVAALVALPTIAAAGLKDVGPVNPATGFPAWYRDTSGTALSLCTDMRPSPNAEAGGAPMCFPIDPDPAGYPGNLGGEIFYSSVGTSLAGANGFSLRWEGALEATYATGTPVRGDEIVFARIRIIMDTSVGGTYTVVHPYGVEVFPNVQPGKRSVAYTIDIGVAPGVFTGALGGAVGPFLRWEQDPGAPGAPYGLDPVSGLPYRPELVSANGTVTRFLGDPNFFHAVEGSPFLTNFVRVEGPPGSNLDGLGNGFLITNQFTVVGQRHDIPIPVPLEVYRANVSVDGGVTQVDVFAESVPGAKLIATAENVPTMELSVDPSSGEAYGHAEFLASGPVGALVTVTNVADTPHGKHVAHLTDIVSTGPAVLFPDPTGVTGGTLSISTQTSVHAVPAPLISLVELPDAMWIVNDPARPWIQDFFATLPAGATPPWHLTAVSTAGGSRAEPVVLGASGVLVNPIRPTALPQVLHTMQGTPVSFLAIDPASPAAAIMILNPPANGAATANADGTVTYVPAPLFSGTDGFTFLLYEPDLLNPGKLVYSNAGNVSVAVDFSNQPPVATTDLATVAPGTSVVIDLAANDTDVDGEVVPTTVAITSQPFAGTVVNNGNGTVTYTPSPGVSGPVSFTYTIRDDLGAVSAPGTVQVTVLPQAEVLAITRAEWIASKQRWRVDGTSSVFGPGVANTVTVRIGVAPTLGGVVGSSVIGPTGTWTVDVTSPLTLDASGRVTAISTGGGTASAAVRRK